MSATNPPLQRLAELVAARRRELGISQRELADRAGITRDTILRIESEKTQQNFTIDSIVKLLHALELDLTMTIVDHAGVSHEISFEDFTERR